MAGKDLLCVMENQHVTRRAKSYAMEKWGIITSVVKRNTNFEERFPVRMGAPARTITGMELINQSGQTYTSENSNSTLSDAEKRSSGYRPVTITATLVGKVN
jgi:hypothetical protein